MGLRPPWVKISHLVGSTTARDPLGVDGDDDALGAELLGSVLDEGTIVHGRGVDRDLVRARFEQFADIVQSAHAPADGERHEAALGRRLDDVEDHVAILVACRDVEKAKLVRAGGIVGGGRLDRVAGIDEVHEVDAFDDAPVFHVEAGNDAGFQHGLESGCVGDATEDRGHGELDAEAECS